MNKVHILLVEDNEGDIFLTLEAFKAGKILTEISVVKNGEEALDFIFKRGEFKNAASPDLILLDINIPLKSGHDVLKILKADEVKKKIPVIMLTTSSAQADINLAYSNYVNSYVTKPLDMDQFMKAILKIEEFWLDLIKLPKVV